MSTDPAVQAAEDALYAIGASESYTFAKLAKAAVEAARPIIEAEALNHMADDLGKNVACPDCLRARAAVRTEPENE